MKVQVENKTGEAVRLGPPIRCMVKDGETREFDDIPESGVGLMKVMNILMMAKRRDGLTVRYFKGDPEEEFEVVRVSLLPGLRKKA